MTDIKKLYGVCVQIDGAEGYQTFGVMATSKQDAAKRWNDGETAGLILDSEVEVYGLSKAPASADDVEEYFDWKSDADILAKLKADNAELLIALSDLANHYCELVSSGDAGNWDPHEEAVIKRCADLIQKHKEPINGN